MARSFDGLADYLSTSATAVSAFGYTIAAWFKTSSFASGNYFFQFGNTENANDRAGINFISTGALECSLRSGTNTRTWRTTATASTGTWIHAAGTFTSSTSLAAYLNGSTAGSYVASQTTTWSTFNTTTIGALNRSALLYSLGEVAECAIWSEVLSTADIQLLAAGIAPTMMRPQSIVNYWPLHGRGGAGGDEEDWAGSLVMSQTSSPAVTDHPRIIYPRRRTHVYVPGAAATVPTLSASTYVPGSLTSTGWRPRVTAEYA